MARLQICRDECEMLETSICRMEYAIAKKHPIIGAVLTSCESLPPAGSKESVNCLRLGVPNVVQVVHGMYILSVRGDCFASRRLYVENT